MDGEALVPPGMDGSSSKEEQMQAYEQAASVLRSRAGRIPGERFQLAMFNAMKGDMDMALMSMVDPMSVPPAYQGEFYKTIDLEGLSDEAENTGIIGALKKIATNPMTMMALTLGTVLPVGTKDQIRTYLATSDDYSRRMGSFLRNVSGPNELFRDKSGKMMKAGKYLFEMNLMIDQGRERYARLLNNARREYEKLNKGPMSAEGSARLSILLEQSWSKKNEVWKRIRELTKKDVGPIQITPTAAEERLLTAMDYVRKDFHESVFKKLKGEQFKKLRRELSKSGLFTGIPSEETLATYYPHYLHVDPKKLAIDISSLVKQGKIDEAIALSNPLAPRQSMSWYQYRDMVVGGPTPRSLHRRGAGVEMVNGDPKIYNMLLPSPEHLKNVAKYLKPGSVEAVEQILADPERYRMPGTKVRYSTYSMDTLSVWGRYIDSMTRFKAWTMSGLGKALKAELPIMRHRNPELANLMEQVYMPMIQGMLTPNQFARAASWETAKVHWIKTLQTSPFFKEGASKKVADWLTTSLVGNGPLASRIGAEGAISSWLYLGALGNNVGSAFNNLMQTTATTIPKLGYRATMAGVWKTLQQLQKYGSARAKGVNPDDAFKGVFGDFLLAGLDKDPTTGGEAFKRVLDQAWARSAFSKGGKVAGGWDRIKSVMMLPFTSAERWNWLVAFNAAQHSGKAAGLTRNDMIRFGRQIVEETQFMSGPMMSPSATAQWSGPLRMFTQFPLRLASFFGNSLSRGVGQIMQGKRPAALGTIARAVSAGMIAKEFAGAFGLDVSRGMAWEGLPFPTSDRPFSPFPIVPPILGIAGAAGMDLAAGEFDKSRFVWPMLIPGGLGLSKAAALFSKDFSKATGRSYIDYNNPDPQGRMAMYTPEGQLVQYLTPTQIVLQGLGLRTTDVVQEQESLKYVMSQRDQIREIRQSMLDGIAQNDSGALMSATQTWRRMFPNAPMPVKKSDIQAIQDRRMLMRTERVLKTLPPEVRAQIAGAVPAAVAENVPGYFFSPQKRRDEELQTIMSPFIGHDMTEENYSGT